MHNLEFYDLKVWPKFLVIFFHFLKERVEIIPSNRTLQLYLESGIVLIILEHIKTATFLILMKYYPLDTGKLNPDV